MAVCFEVYALRVTERPEVYCPGGQEILAGIGGIFTCGTCAPQKYKIKRDLEKCMNCPAGSDCPVPGTTIPTTSAGFWRKNFASNFDNSQRNFLKSPYDKRKRLDFGIQVERDGTLEGYAFWSCPNEEACLGGMNSTCVTGHLQGAPVCGVCCNEILWPNQCNDRMLYGQPAGPPGAEGSGG